MTLSHKFAKQSRVRIFRNEHTRSTPLDPKLMFWGISDRFVTAQKSMQNWLNWWHHRTSSLNKVASEFFATDAPDPLHLTQNSSFGAFQTILLLHKSRCKTGQTGGIIAQVLNKVASEFFATNAPDPLHLTQNSCFGAFRTVSLLHESRCKTGRTDGINKIVTTRKSMQNLPNCCH
jgi:hypothetical protein